MIFTIELLLPANTPKNTPVIQSMKVTKGLIYRVEFQFPPGCAGLAYMQMYDGGVQLYPSSMAEWFHTDNMVIGFDDLYLKLIPPWEFDFAGYNLDDTYPHIIYCRLGLVDKDEYMARFLPTVGYEALVSLQQKAAEDQRAKMKEVLASPFPWITPGKRKT